MHTIASLKNDLAAMGLHGRETILVHSSMKSIGAVENRADGVLDALSEYFADGLLVFPTLSYLYVNDRPGLNHFEVDSTPACTGILPELFRKRPGVVRSLHPIHSLAALGKDAEAFTVGHERFDTAFNRQGPFGRLFARQAQVLCIGVTLVRATCLHALEEWAQVPVLSAEPLHLFSTGKDGKTVPVKVHWHTGAHSEEFDRALPLVMETGAVKPCRFGDAPSLLLDCKKTEETLLPLLERNPDFFKPEKSLPF
jgi:aminoglycoside 3-N-acetyltransferase